MSEDLQCQRYYVLERISELREQIPQAMQAMVVFRARIENTGKRIYPPPMIPTTHSAASVTI